MARKSVPFKVVVHYMGKKSKAEIQEIYADFYVSHVKKVLDESGLSGSEKRAIIDRLIAYFDKNVQEKAALKHT